MKPWRLTGMLLLVAVITLTAVPPLRNVVVAAVRSGQSTALFGALFTPWLRKFAHAAGNNVSGAELGEMGAGMWLLGLGGDIYHEPSQKEYEAVALAHPNDPGLWWGYAEISRGLEVGPDRGPHGKTTTTQAFAKAIRLSRRPAVIRFRYALYLLSKTGLMSRTDLQPWSIDFKWTPQQTANLHAAQRVLLRLRRELPQNAACDYFLAWTYLAEKKDAAAIAAARDALGKQAWSLYQAPAEQAAWRVADALPETDEGNLDSLSYNSHADDRDVPELLSVLGDRFRKAGKNSEAIACYESVIHFGHLERLNAFSIMDGLVSVVCTDVVRHDFASPSLATKSAGGHRTPYAVLDKIRRPKFLAYLRANGRPDLARFYQQEMAAADAWHKASEQAVAIPMDDLIDAVLGRGIASSMGLWVSALLFLVLAICLALPTFFARIWRGPSRTVAWSYGDWLKLMVVAILPGALVGLYFDTRAAPFHVWGGKAGETIPIACLAGVIAWLVAAGVSVAHHRAEFHAEPRRQRPSYHASLMLLALPTFGALALASVIFIWPLSGANQRSNVCLRKIAVQGEVAYCHIKEKAREILRQEASQPSALARPQAHPAAPVTRTPTPRANPVPVGQSPPGQG